MAKADRKNLLVPTTADNTQLANKLPATVNRSYDIGYARPPAAMRFQKGKSGNPKGRPRGSKNKSKFVDRYGEQLKALILDEAYRLITMTDAQGVVTMPMAQAVLRSIAVNAVKGNHRSQRLFTQLVGTTERENRRLHDEWFDAAVTYKIEWDKELRRRETLGIAGPEPLPHPNHIELDMNKGTAYIRGPATKDEKVQWDLWHEYYDEFRRELADFKQWLTDTDDKEERRQLESDIAATQKAIDALEIVFKSGRIPPTFPMLNQGPV
ncbi:MAG TPA: DUF5681 domain-containing protein [Rhizobiaceae bacterium]|nr:DUF5681 domain-containing protein [Rhizobiaceae bacterium]